MSKPTIKRGPASPYAMADETIVEVFSKSLGIGCLLSVREHDGKLVIEAYRGDPKVVVRAGGRDYRVAA